MNVRRFHAGWIWDLRWISANIFASAADDFTIKICRVGRDAPLHTLMHHVRPQKFRHGISPSLYLTVLFLKFLHFQQFHWVYSLRWNDLEAQLASCSHDGSIKVRIY